MPTNMPELERLFGALAVASKVTKYYPPGHPQIEETLSRVLSQIAALVGKGSALTISVADDGLYVSSSRLLRFDASETLFHNLRDLGIREVVLSPGVDQEELLQFVTALARDPKKSLEEGGLARVLKQRRVGHITVASTDLTAAERRARLDSLRAMPPQERAEAFAIARRWLEGAGPPMNEEETLKVIGALWDAKELTGLIEPPGPEGYDRRRLEMLVRLWGVVAGSGFEANELEAVLARETVTTDPRTLLEVADEDRSGVPAIQKLFERLGPQVCADIIAARLEASPADAAAWLTALESLLRKASSRRAVLYRVLQKVRDRPDLADVVASLEDELAAGSREESAFLALLRGAQHVASAMPASWTGRWGGGVLVRRATGVLERAGVGEEQRFQWLAYELERLVKAQDADGVAEVLEVVGDPRTRYPSSEASSLVSPQARKSLPAFLTAAPASDRIRILRALMHADRAWRDVAGSLLDTADQDLLGRTVAELRGIGVEPHDLALELMQSEKPEDIAKGIRIAGALSDPDAGAILEGLLGHGSPLVRMEAVATLARIAPTVLLARLPEILKDANPLVGARALEVLAGVPDATQVLVDTVRGGLLRAIGEETGVAIVEFVSVHGTADQQAALAESVLAPRILGKPVPQAVRDAVRGFLGEDRRRGLRGLFSHRSG